VTEIDDAVAEPLTGLFIFSLGATPARFDLVNREKAVHSNRCFFGFGDCGNNLYVCNSGLHYGSVGQRDFAGPRGRGQLVGRTVGDWIQSFEGRELWHLGVSISPDGWRGR
jgi:hypothetical protein